MVANTVQAPPFEPPAFASPTPDELRDYTERTLIEMLETALFWISERQQKDELMDARIRSIESRLGMEFNGVPSNG